MRSRFCERNSFNIVAGHTLWKFQLLLERQDMRCSQIIPKEIVNLDALPESRPINIGNVLILDQELKAS